MIKQVHAGFRYTPLTERTTATLNSQGLTGADWQPLVPRDTPTSPGGLQQQQQGGGGGAGSSEGGGSGAAAAAQLRLALEKLCGCSVTEAMLNDPITAGGTAAALAAATAAAAAAAASTPPPSEAAGSRPPSTAETAEAAAAGAGQDAHIDAAAAAAASAAVSAAAAAVTGEAPTATSSESSKDPVWLYINHLGWCRCVSWPLAHGVPTHTRIVLLSLKSTPLMHPLCGCRWRDHLQHPVWCSPCRRSCSADWACACVRRSSPNLCCCPVASCVQGPVPWRALCAGTHVRPPAKRHAGRCTCSWRALRCCQHRHSLLLQVRTEGPDSCWAWFGQLRGHVPCMRRGTGHAARLWQGGRAPCFPGEQALPSAACVRTCAFVCMRLVPIRFAVLRCAVLCCRVLRRPLGVLLDNVAKGWTYNHVTWSDVATKDLASTTMVCACVCRQVGCCVWFGCDRLVVQKTWAASRVRSFRAAAA